MTSSTSRHGLLKRRSLLKLGAIGAGAATAAGAAPPGRAGAAVLDTSITSPYPPYLTFSYPSSWFMHTALIPGVVMPYDVIVCNRHLSPLPDIAGAPDLRAVPGDATMLVLLFWEPVPAAKANLSGGPVRLQKGMAMRFSDLGGGQRNWHNFRAFTGWYVATSGDLLYSIEADVYVGPDAGAEWKDVQSIVSSIRHPG